MIDQSSATTDNAELIARLRARKGFGRFHGDVTWLQLDQPDKDCADAADALDNADKRIVELEEQIAEQVSTIKDNILTITTLAREAGEASAVIDAGGKT